MEKRAKLAEEFGSVEAFAGKGSLYKRSSTYPKKAVQGAVRYGLEKVLGVSARTIGKMLVGNEPSQLLTLN